MKPAYLICKSFSINLLRVPRPILLAVALTFSALPLNAGQRRFSYLYETVTAPKGSLEFENWITWKHRDDPRGEDFERFEFRHEFEIGVTDRLQLGLYVADWQYDQDDSEGHQARYGQSGIEAIYNLSNPTTDPLGSALYGEVLIGEEKVELEAKILFEKRFGPLTLVYNATLEAEWEGEEYHEETGEFQEALGVSYDLNKRFSFGAELLHEIEMPDWENTNDGLVYAGPNASIRYGRVFATLTGLWQITNVQDEADFQARLIFGIDF